MVGEHRLPSHGAPRFSISPKRDTYVQFAKPLQRDTSCMDTAQIDKMVAEGCAVVLKHAGNKLRSLMPQVPQQNIALLEQYTSSFSSTPDAYLMGSMSMLTNRYIRYRMNRTEHASDKTYFISRTQLSETLTELSEFIGLHVTQQLYQTITSEADRFLEKQLGPKGPTP